LTIAPYGRNSEGIAHLPNPTQQRVLDWVDNVRNGKHKGNGIPVLYLQGGVGAGKTRAFLAPVNEMLFEIPDLKVLWGRQDFADLRLSAMDTFLEVMPGELIADKNEQEHKYVIAQSGEKQSKIYFRDLKDLKGLGSQEFGIIVVTEAHEISLNAYRTLKQRARQQNVPTMILMEGNPPNEDHWLNNVLDPEHDDFDSDIEKWEVSTRENWSNLSEVYRNSLEKMPNSWKIKYLEGRTGFTPDGRPFYEGFKEELHTGDFDWNTQIELLGGFDYGYHHPAHLITQIGTDGRWYILKEILGNDEILDFFADRCLGLVNVKYPNALWRYYGDPAGKQVNDKSEKTSEDILKGKKINVQSRPSSYRERKEIIEKLLNTMINGKPALMVDKSCRIIIDGFLGGYHYPVAKEGETTPEVPVKDGYYEHLMNALEYIAVNIFTAVKRNEPAPQPPIFKGTRSGWGR